MMPFRAMAWEDDAVLSFISRANPIIQAQRHVTQAYTKPNAVTWALQNTSLSGRLGFGGTEFRDAPYTTYGGVQINIPLSSIKEERDAQCEYPLKGTSTHRAQVNSHLQFPDLFHAHYLPTSLQATPKRDRKTSRLRELKIHVPYYCL